MPPQRLGGRFMKIDNSKIINPKLRLTVIQKYISTLTRINYFQSDKKHSNKIKIPLILSTFRNVHCK